MSKIVEVIDRIPQIKTVTLEENINCYILSVYYEPRYGHGCIYNGSSYGKNDQYQFIAISDIDAWENWKDNDEFKPQSEIRLRLPKRAYFHSYCRDKECESYIFTKKSFNNTKTLFQENFE